MNASLFLYIIIMVICLFIFSFIWKKIFFYGTKVKIFLLKKDIIEYLEINNINKKSKIRLIKAVELIENNFYKITILHFIFLIISNNIKKEKDDENKNYFPVLFKNIKDKKQKLYLYKKIIEIINYSIKYTIFSSIHTVILISIVFIIDAIIKIITGEIKNTIIYIKNNYHKLGKVVVVLNSLVSFKNNNIINIFFNDIKTDNMAVEKN